MLYHANEPGVKADLALASCEVVAGVEAKPQFVPACRITISVEKPWLLAERQPEYEAKLSCVLYDKILRNVPVPCGGLL